MHTAVGRAVLDRLSALPELGVAVLDAVKLYEGGLHHLTNELWYVRCQPETAARRLRELRGMSPEHAAARLRAQPPFNAEKQAACTEIIDNDGDIAALERTVGRLFAEFQRRHAANI